jgi:hypothetical protein
MKERKGYVNSDYFQTAARLFDQAKNLSYSHMQITPEILPHFTADYQLFRQMASINETELAAIDAGLLTPNEIDRWRRDLERSANQGTFFACVNLILLSGTKIL